MAWREELLRCLQSKYCWTLKTCWTLNLKVLSCSPANVSFGSSMIQCSIRKANYSLFFLAIPYSAYENIHWLATIKALRTLLLVEWRHHSSYYWQLLMASGCWKKKILILCANLLSYTSTRCLGYSFFAKTFPTKLIIWTMGQLGNRRSLFILTPILLRVSQQENMPNKIIFSALCCNLACPLL